MIRFGNKVVYTDFSELVDPSHTALLVIDMQRDFVTDDGVFASLSGGDLSAYPPVIKRIAAFAATARRHNVPVIHTRNVVLPNYASDSPAQIRFTLRISHERGDDQAPLRYTIAGTPGAEFIPELAPQPGDRVVVKHRSSGFCGTDLDMLLRGDGIETIIITGCTTEGCVESTARDAAFNDYYVVIAEDCVASNDQGLHEASLRVMKDRFDVASEGQLVACWEADRRSGF